MIGDIMFRPILLAGVLGALAPALLGAQDSVRIHEPGVMPDSNRIGVMSPQVVRQRLRMLGYTNIAVVERQQSVVLANTLKAGRATAVKLDPYSGKVVAVPGRLRRMPEGLRLIRPSGVVAPPPR